jgi:hypothetical protein
LRRGSFVPLRNVVLLRQSWSACKQQLPCNRMFRRSAASAVVVVAVGGVLLLPGMVASERLKRERTSIGRALVASSLDSSSVFSNPNAGGSKSGKSSPSSPIAKGFSGELPICLPSGGIENCMLQLLRVGPAIACDALPLTLCATYLQYMRAANRAQGAHERFLKKHEGIHVLMQWRCRDPYIW